MLLLGLKMLLPYVRQPGVVFILVLCLVVSHILMFTAGYRGWPNDVLTNPCVNIFVAGLGVKLHARYEKRYGKIMRVWMPFSPMGLGGLSEL